MVCVIDLDVTKLFKKDIDKLFLFLSKHDFWVRLDQKTLSCVYIIKQDMGLVAMLCEWADMFGFVKPSVSYTYSERDFLKVFDAPKVHLGEQSLGKT